MSSASPQVIEYLTRQLGRNPIHESGEIVRARAKAFKLEPQTTTAAKPAPPSGQRQKVRDELETIRAQCFSGPAEPMQRSLAALPLADYPDLAVLAYRLQVILDSRAKLPALSQHPQFDGDFFSVLKQVLVSPPREVAVLREQVLASFRIRRNRNRGQAMMRLLRSETPELYALEADWLDSLARYRGSKYLWGAPRTENTAYSSQSSNSGSTTWPIWIFVVITFALIRSFLAREEPNRSSAPFRPPATHQSIESQRVDESLDRLHELQHQQEESHQEHLRRMSELMKERREALKQEHEEARKRTEDYFNTFDEEDSEFLQPKSTRGGIGPADASTAPDFNAGPFATPRVVPMPSMPADPRP